MTLDPAPIVERPDEPEHQATGTLSVVRVSDVAQPELYDGIATELATAPPDQSPRAVVAREMLELVLSNMPASVKPWSAPDVRILPMTIQADTPSGMTNVVTSAGDPITVPDAIRAVRFR